MRNIFIGLIVLWFLSCGKDSNGPGSSTPINVTGTVWKIVAAEVQQTTISQSPKKTIDIFFGDSASIAEKVSGFGKYNYLSFFTNDSLEIYSTIVPDRHTGEYGVQDSTVYAFFVPTVSTILNLKFTMDHNNQLALDYPAAEVRWYSPSVGMAETQTFSSLQERNDFVATLDTSFHAASMDSLVYSTVTYYYIQQ
jgi:hypothetical protein